MKRVSSQNSRESLDPCLGGHDDNDSIHLVTARLDPSPTPVPAQVPLWNNIAHGSFASQDFERTFFSSGRAAGRCQQVGRVELSRGGTHHDVAHGTWPPSNAALEALSESRPFRVAPNPCRPPRLRGAHRLASLRPGKRRQTARLRGPGHGRLECAGAAGRWRGCNKPARAVQTRSRFLVPGLAWEVAHGRCRDGRAGLSRPWSPASPGPAS